MKINYLLSIVYLLLSFLMIKKSNKKLSITLEIIYSIALLFCYNVVVVYFLSCFHIDGSLFIYSIINYVVGSILLIFNMKRKNIQRYSFHKKELIVVLCIIIVLFLISYFRFRGFTAISYESSDSGIHYRQALYFSKELTLLNHDNSKDLVYSDFNRVMPISYINGGFTLKVFSQNKPYYVFLGYDVFCLIIGALLFFCTISRLLDMKSKYYFYSFIITLFYILAYPLNSFLFGFCYLGLGIIVINLSYLTILKIANDWQSNWIFNLILLFIIHFSLFFSYYLFVPCIYLSLGLYYIYLWKTKKMNFKKLLLYGGITLVIPFIIGFTYFILPSFGLKEQANVLNTINLKGYSYENIAPIYLFVVYTLCLIYQFFSNKKKSKTNILNFYLYVVTGNVFLFFVLYVLGKISAYYFYKLFYVYWLLVILSLVGKVVSYQKYVYLLFVMIMVTSGYIILYPNTKMTKVLTKLDIYHWNTRIFLKDKIIYTKGEIELMEESMKYKDICVENNRFIILGNENKNVWFYSITNMIPTLTLIHGDSRQLYLTPNPTLETWNAGTDYDCAIYFYEDKKKEYEEEKYEVLYSNREGSILKRRKT